MNKELTPEQRAELTEKAKKCVGCRDNFYNSSRSTTGFCWLLPEAKEVLKQEIHLDQIPPFKNKPQALYDCYRRPGYAYRTVEKP